MLCPKLRTLPAASTQCLEMALASLWSSQPQLFARCGNRQEICLEFHLFLSHLWMSTMTRIYAGGGGEGGKQKWNKYAKQHFQQQPPEAAIKSVLTRQKDTHSCKQNWRSTTGAGAGTGTDPNCLHLQWIGKDLRLRSPVVWCGLLPTQLQPQEQK